MSIVYVGIGIGIDIDIDIDIGSAAHHVALVSDVGADMAKFPTVKQQRQTLLGTLRTRSSRPFE